jgi:hypothetical protein
MCKYKIHPLAKLLRRLLIQMKLCQVFAKSLRLYRQHRQPLIRYLNHRHHRHLNWLYLQHPEQPHRQHHHRLYHLRLMLNQYRRHHRRKLPMNR